MKKALIAMSGGVDSSVAAYLTKQAGYDCIGVTMRLFDGENAVSEKTCCSEDDVLDAKSVARGLGIPHHTFNFKSDFNIDYYNQILLAPSKHKRSNTSYKNSKNNYKSENNRKKANLSPSDVLLMENYNNFPYNKKSEILDMRGYYLNNKYEKYKLRNLAEMLNIQRKENNDIILSNKKEIAKLKKRLSLMSVKLKNKYDLQI